MFKSMRRCRFLSTVSCALALVGGIASAAAAPLTALQLSVNRDGTPDDWVAGRNILLADQFNNGNPLVGPNFTGGPAATYTLWGSNGAANAALAATEQGGGLLLDPAYAAVNPDASGQLGRALVLTLQTNLSDPAGGLSRSRSFGASLVFSLAALPSTGQSLGLRFSDSFNNLNDVIELAVVGGMAGEFIRFQRPNFSTGINTRLGTVALAPPNGAVGLVLSLSHAAADTDLIYGSYAYTTQTELIGSFTTFAATPSAFHGELHTRVELLAAQAVPEPGTYAMMLAGLGMVALITRRWKSGKTRAA